MDNFFSNSRSIISAMDLRISVPMTFMRSLGLRQFFYRKRKLIFLDHFFSNSRSIISGTDLRISVLMTFMRSPGHRPFLYIYIKKYFWDHFFFKFAVIISGSNLRISGPMTFLRSPDITLGQSQCAIWKSMQKVKRFFFLGIYIFLWVGPNFESPDRFKLR